MPTENDSDMPNKRKELGGGGVCWISRKAGVLYMQVVCSTERL